MDAEIVWWTICETEALAICMPVVIITKYYDTSTDRIRLMRVGRVGVVVSGRSLPRVGQISTIGEIHLKQSSSTVHSKFTT